MLFYLKYVKIRGVNLIMAEYLPEMRWILDFFPGWPIWANGTLVLSGDLDSNFTMERRPPRTKEVTGTRQPILIKLWILHLMTHFNKVYDTTPNLNHSKSQLISTNSNAYIGDNSQLILFKLWILHPRTNHNKVYNTTPNLN